MIYLLLSVITSLVGIVVAVTLPQWSDFLFVAGPSALAGMFLLLRAWVRRSKSARDAARNWVVLDGSNVMHWKDGTPKIGTVQEVVTHLSKHGFSPTVVFDANAGYLVSGRYRHDAEMGNALDLPEERVMVVPKGTPADPVILTAARELGALIITNDRYRDWADDYPEIRDPGLLIRGGYRSGRVWLDLESDAKR